MIYIFTDGSSLIHDNKYEASSAIIAIDEDGNEVLRQGTYHINGTNSLGELYAMLMALKFSDRLNKLKIRNCIISDSEYIVKSLTKWIYKWATNNWIGSKGEEIKFSDIFKDIYDKYIITRKILLSPIYHITSHNKTDSEIVSAYEKFNEFNRTEISFDEFKKFVKYNDEVDKLAYNIRINKIINYYKEESNIWAKKLKRINGRISISKRGM